jgi:DNA invertase Pin-like site-specific DNA recombinase
MFHMMGVFAEFERSIIQERVRAGLRKTREEGRNERGRTKGVRKIATELGVSPTTVAK